MIALVTANPQTIEDRQPGGERQLYSRHLNGSSMVGIYAKCLNDLTLPAVQSRSVIDDDGREAVAIETWL